MKIGATRLFEHLAKPEPIFGMLFLSYTFDPVFFEREVLATLLRIETDPDDDALRFHGEVRSALRETPVVCIVDAGAREPGRTLPYDLLEVRARTFHPKVSLVLYEEEARFAIGSGNLTRGGFGRNAELFVLRSLSYADPHDARVLRDLMDALGGLGDLVRDTQQLQDVRREVARRIAATPPPSKPGSLALLTTAQRPMIDEIRALLPRSAVLERLGILAPFFQRDDAPELREEPESVVGALLSLAPSAGCSLEIGCPWDDSPTGHRGTPPQRVTDHLGRMWGAQVAEEEGAHVVYGVFSSVKGKTLTVQDEYANSRRYPLAQMQDSLDDGSLFLVDEIRCRAPRGVFDRLQKQHIATQLWLHPARRIERGKYLEQPLHAKVFLLGIRTGKDRSTLVVVGSPNASRRAMLQGPSEGGNVEVAVAMLVPGDVRLVDVCPDLVACPLELVTFDEPEFPAPAVDMAAWIESADCDAASRTLTVHWAARGPAPLEAWTLRYMGDPIASGSGAPPAVTVIRGFDLRTGSAEIQLVTGGVAYPIQIVVLDMAQLPADPSLVELSLEELLALVGRRLGQERVAALRRSRGAAGALQVLEAIHGEGVQPTDVFRACWSIGERLAQPSRGVVSFRAELEGSTGAACLWSKLREAADTGRLTSDEAWFYGHELIRSLEEVVPLLRAGDVRDGAEKATLVRDFVTQRRAELAQRRPTTEGRPWMQSIATFYGEALQ